MTTGKIQIWDTPLRVFHWLLVFTVAAAYFTAEVGGELTDWHGRIGALALGLVSFRIIWGFLGSTHARFLHFFPTPSRLASYFKGKWHQDGHNPLGALSVIALIALLAALIISGLFSNDDIAFKGPLYNLVDKDSSDWLTGLHESAFDILLLLICLHIAAILFYLLIKNNNLIKPMITGYKQTKDQALHQISGGGTLRFVIALSFSAFIVWLVFSGILEPAQAMADQAPPAW